jgi:hypothetical protein
MGFRVSGRQWAMPILRSCNEGAFTREGADQMQWIVPHLRRMISISEKLTLGRIGSMLDLLELYARLRPGTRLAWPGHSHE